MLADNVIQPSKSPRASPVVLLKKKDNTLCFCAENRQLNIVTKREVYEFHRTDEMSDLLCNAKFFPSLELKSGHWQMELEESDCEQTAFVTPDGIYEFKALPFGVCCAPTTFQSIMNTILAGRKWQICLIYLDDAVVFFRAFEDHLTNATAKSSGSDPFCRAD